MNNMAKNSLFNILYKGCNVLYPMIVSAYISRIFMADGVGQIYFAINIITYFTIAASLGIPNYAVKILASQRDCRCEINKRFSEMASLIFISSAGVSVIYYISIFFMYSGSQRIISFILGLMLISNVFNYDWLYEALEKFSYLAIRTIIIKACTLLFMFLFVKSRDDVIVYCFLYSMTTVFNNISNRIFAGKYVSFTKEGLDFKNHIKPVLILFAAAFATELYTLLDSTMLGIMCESRYLGYYTNASKTVRAAYGVLFAATGVYNPRLSYIYGIGDKKAYKAILQKYYDMSMWLAIPAMLGLMILSDKITVLLFGIDFIPATITLKILSVLIVIFTLATVFGHIPLVIYGKERNILYATIVGAIINFSLNQLMIPFLNNNGAAIASIASETIVTFILMYSSLKFVRIKIINKNLITEIISTIIMSFIVYLINRMISNMFLCIIMSLIVGVISYVLSLLILKNDIIHNAFNCIRRKIQY